MKLEAGTNLTLWSVSCVGIVFSNGACCQLVESNLVSWQQPELEDFHGTLSTKNSIGYNPVLVLAASFGYKRWPAGALFLPPLFRDFIWIAFIYVYILESFYCIQLSYYPSNGPYLAICPCVPSLTLFSSPPYLLLLFPSIHNYLFYFPFLCPLVPYFIPTLCGSVD